MAEILTDYKIFYFLPRYIVKNIKCFYVPYQSSKIAYCVTKDDDVYGVGQGVIQLLGYGESPDNKKFVLISELCAKNIEEFYVGIGFLFARSAKNEIYSAGSNSHGLLARGHIRPGYFRPQKVFYFEDKNIVQIGCGLSLCLALSSTGLVYGWGDRNTIRVRSGHRLVPKMEFIQVIPSPLKSNNTISKIEFIECFGDISYAFTVEGHIYCYETNYWEYLYGLNDLCKAIELFEQNTLEPDAYKLDDIMIGNTEFICQTMGSVYRIDRNDRSVRKCSQKNLLDFYFQEKESTSRTIHLVNDHLFVIEFVKSEDYPEHLLTKHFKPINTKGRLKECHEMVSNLKRFRTTNDLPQTLDSKVKHYYQSGRYSSTYFSLFVMQDNNVYAFGHNYWGKLGLGNGIDRTDYVPELCDQNIEEFFEAQYCMFGRNDKNEVFGWGRNHHGQLGIGLRSEWQKYVKPTKLNDLKNKNIIDISCGQFHCLALSSDGTIYGWGYNGNDQVACGYDHKYVLYPIRIDSNHGIPNKNKFLNCYQDSSFAVSLQGQCYYWGQIKVATPHQAQPKSIFIENVALVYRDGIVDTCASILTTNATLYRYNLANDTFIEIKTTIRFSDMLFVKDIFQMSIVLQSGQGVYEFDQWNKANKLKKTTFVNFYDYYIQKFDFTFKTIHVSEEGYLMLKTIKLNENYPDNIDENPLITECKNVFHYKYMNHFEELDIIGQGVFGTVFKVKETTTDELFAIKRICVRKNFDLILNEIRIMSELDHYFVIKYTDSWIEGKIIDRKITNYAYIQMELCSQNLQDLIKSIEETFDDRYETFKYFIRSELLLELIECLNYLHSSKPPIIHRDLKPPNILVTDGINGRFLKLCDFGLSKLFEGLHNSQGVGTFKYMAPEVRETNNYNLLSDVYSLGVIATKIFQINENIKLIRKKTVLDKYLEYYSNSSLNEMFRKGFEVISIMLSKKPEDRISCGQMLNRANEWTVAENIVTSDECFAQIMEKFKNNFFGTFMETKLKIKQKKKQIDENSKN